VIRVAVISQRAVDDQRHPRAAAAGHSELLLELQVEHVHDEVREDRRLVLAD
jgi:hypothetical protein